jgi:hypothetical protein
MAIIVFYHLSLQKLFKLQPCLLNPIIGRQAADPVF